jgi:DNA ligase-1
VTLFSRSGKLLQNFPHIEQELATNRALRKLLLSTPTQVLDGEIVGASFQQLMRQTHRKRDAETQDAVFHIFDIIPYSDFQAGHWNMSQRKRSEILEKVQGALIDDSQCLRVVPGIEVDLDTSSGREVMHRFANDAVDQGFEGIMIKHLDAPYECRRSSAWLKWKPFIEVSLTVVAVEPGTGRNQGRLGALVCEGIDEDRLIRVNVGSGFTDRDRGTFWTDQQLVVGQVIEVRADAVTQNQDQTYSLRFPRFLRFRGFEPGEKI